MARVELTGGDGVTGQTGKEFRDAINAMTTELYAASHSRAHEIDSADDHNPKGPSYYLMFLTIGDDGNPLLRLIADTDIPDTIARVLDLTTHTEDTNNPHQVTAEQLGISTDITSLLAGLGISIVEGDDVNTISFDPTTLDSVTDMDPTDTVIISIGGTPKQIPLSDFQAISTNITLFRGRVYDVNDSYHGVEVLATGEGVTAVISGGNVLTFDIPEGIRLISAKIIFTGFTTLDVVMGTGDMGNSSMADRWIPLCQVWREDTGQAVGASTISMSLTNFDKFTINGLIAAQNNHIRLSF